MQERVTFFIEFKSHHGFYYIGNNEKKRESIAENFYKCFFAIQTIDLDLPLGNFVRVFAIQEVVFYEIFVVDYTSTCYIWLEITHRNNQIWIGKFAGFER